MELIKGRARKYGDNINTDIITPGKYMELSIEDMKKHVMEGVDEHFYKRIQKGDILVCENNCGSGSSRETAPIALKASGINAVVACSFARIFYRNSFNIGLPALEISEAVSIEENDILEINLAKGIIKNITKNEHYKFNPIPPILLDMLEAGGLVPQLKKQFGI